MAIPQPVLDIINKLDIAGLPNVVNPGEVLKPQLNPGLDALDALGLGKVLASLDLKLDKVVLDVTEMAFGKSTLDLNLDAQLKDATSNPPGTADLKVVLEAVEIPKPAATQAAGVNPDLTATGELPYLAPITSSLPAGYVLQLGSHVQGLLGKLAGEIAQVEKLKGKVEGTLAPIQKLLASLTGDIKGNISEAKLLKEAPTITVQWKIEGNHVLLDNTTLDNPLVPPVVAVLPEFAELTAGGPIPTSQLSISCDVKIDVTLTDGSKDSRTQRVGPVQIDVPKIQVPTLVAFTEHGQTDADRFPGRVLMAVPRNSVLSSVTNLKSFLTPVGTVLRRLQETLKVVNAVLSTQFGQAADVIDTLIGLIGQVNQPLIQQDEVWYLYSFTLDPGGLFGFGYKSWEDQISSVLLVGPPGTGVSCHNRRRLWQGTGQFHLIAGLTGAAFALDLNKPAPDLLPAGTVFDVIVPPDNPRGVFNDVISSFRFLPLA